MNDIKELYSLAVQTAKAAGDRLNGITQRTVNCDAGNDVKLQEDIESEKFIRNLLAVSNIPVVGEELEKDTSPMENDGYYWVVDPIDGTFNFLRGYPVVCVSIALMKGNAPKVGVIYDFTRNELFSAYDGSCLYLNGKPLTPNWAKDQKQAVLMTGFPSLTVYDEPTMRAFVARVKKFKKVRMCGSAAISMAYVASGRVDAYVEKRINLWDIAAGLMLVKSAGGAYKMESANLPEKPLCVNINAASCEEFFSE